MKTEKLSTIEVQYYKLMISIYYNLDHKGVKFLWVKMVILIDFFFHNIVWVYYLTMSDTAMVWLSECVGLRITGFVDFLDFFFVV